MSYWETEQLILLAEEVYRNFYGLELVLLEQGAARQRVRRAFKNLSKHIHPIVDRLLILKVEEPLLFC